jgi:hypothetical protein
MSIASEVCIHGVHTRERCDRCEAAFAAKHLLPPTAFSEFCEKMGRLGFDRNDCEAAWACFPIRAPAGAQAVRGVLVMATENAALRSTPADAGREGK